MDAFPELHTPRLTLRKLRVEDVLALVRYADNKKIADRIWNIPYPYREPDAVFRISYVHQGFISKTRYVFAIILKEREELIGEISLHLEEGRERGQLGYWIGEPFWGRGIATEAAGAILAFGFRKLKLEEIYGTCHADNPASAKILLHQGMKREGIVGSILTYGLTREAYENQHNKS